MTATVMTDSSFANDVKKDKYVMIDFWAPWCGPCRQLSPTIDSLAEDMSGKVAIYKMNIDENTDTPTQFGVRSIPTLVLLEDGKQIAIRVGGAPKADLQKWLEENTN